MVTVKQGGRELSVENDEVAKYLEKGYSVIDKDGNIVRKGDVTNFNQALAENKSLREEIALLKREKTVLTEENTALKADLDVYKKQVFNFLTPVEDSEAPADEKKPKRAKKEKTE